MTSTSQKVIVLSLPSEMNLNKVSKTKNITDNLSDAVADLEETEDYLRRLRIATKYGLESDKYEVVDTLRKEFDMAEALMEGKKGLKAGLLLGALNVSEFLVTELVKGAVKLGELTVKSVFKTTENICNTIGEIIDFVNPAPNRMSNDEVIEKVKSGEIVLVTNKQKGNFGEMVQDQVLEKYGDMTQEQILAEYGDMAQGQDFKLEKYIRISKDRVMGLDDKWHQGIDVVYYNIDRQEGEPKYIISEAKYETSRLNYTKYSGKQMSDDWILSENRLAKSVGKTIADDVRNALLTGECQKQVIHVYRDGSYRIEKLK